MKYQHKRTGLVIDVPSELKGNWIKVESEKPSQVSADTSKPEAIKPAKSRRIKSK